MLAGARFVAAFPINTARPTTAVEFYNAHTGHYFLTANGPEMLGIDAGNAGPGWVRTGYGFLVDESPVTAFCGRTCLAVARFYAPSPSSHFYTINTEERAILEQPGTGWISEGFAFSALPVDSSGGCGSYISVYRLYNNRFAFNDSNHRFVTSASERARMVSLGWLDEGVAFCAFGTADVSIKTFGFNPQLNDGKIQPSAVCEDESRNLGACMAINNLTPPTKHLSATLPGTESAVYAQYTGLQAVDTYIADALTTPVAATTVFVQQSGVFQYGVHVDTIQRGPAVFTSVNPLYQFRTSVDSNGVDKRIFPFANQLGIETQLSVSFYIGVKKVATRNSVSHAFGHPTLEFIDQRSGRPVYFTTLVYGTVLANDYLAPDVATGKVIVGTAFRPGSQYMRSVGRDYFPTPNGFISPKTEGEGGYFELRMNRDEFRNVLASARTIYPDLSPEPADYMLDNYHFNNEVYGDGEIGVNISYFRLDLLHR
ncbi:MAG: hypothetical protein ABI669_13730 [Usitatibacter sp.]